MSEEPMTATAMMMQDREGQRLKLRDARVAQAIAQDLLGEYFKPEEIEAMSDVRRAMIYAMERAAYEAIQKEREMHAHDMAMIKRVLDASFDLTALKPPTLIFPARPDHEAAGGG